MDWQAWLDGAREREGYPNDIKVGHMETRRSTTLTDILAAVQEVTGIPPSGVMGRRQHRGVCAARRMAIKLARFVWGTRSDEELARVFKRERSAIGYAMQYDETKRFDARLKRARAAL